MTKYLYIDNKGQLLLRFREIGSFYLEERLLDAPNFQNGKETCELYGPLPGCILYCTPLDQTLNEMQEKVEDDCRYIRELFPDIPIMLVGTWGDRRQPELDHVTSD